VIADIAAIRALLTAAGLANHFVDVSGASTLPYVLLWSPPGGLALERPVADSHADVDVLIGVTAVAGTPEGVLIVQQAVRTALDLKSPVVTGRVTSLELQPGSTPIQMDRDVTIPNTSRNPAYGVDMYRYRSTPA